MDAQSGHRPEPDPAAFTIQLPFGFSPSGPECQVGVSIASFFPWTIIAIVSPDGQTDACTQIEEEPPKSSATANAVIADKL